MNDDFEEEDPSSDVTPSQAEPDVLSLLKKMQQQLTYLEKKVDLLLNQSAEKPFPEKRFSKPFRSGGHGGPRHGHGEGRRDFGGPPRDRGFSGRPDHRPGERNFSRDRQDRGPREGNFSSNRPPFDRPREGGNRGFEPRKKPFFQRRKDRD